MAAIWEQALPVRSRLTGDNWRQSFTGPVPLPSWLVDVVDGHMGAYVGPDPVLFRTAGISLEEWLDTRHDHPGQLQVTCAHSTTPFEAFADAAASVVNVADTTDADVYVWGDGRADGVFCAHIHRVFATLIPGVDVREAGEQLESISDRFIVAIRPGAVELIPRLTSTSRRV
ncbi:hypothetical protein [Microbacterium sp. NPDC055665]